MDNTMLKHSTLLILDFDHTLFNTTKLVQAEAEHFEHVFGISQAVFRQTRDDVKICCVVEDVDRFIALLPHPDKAALRTELLAIIRRVASSCLFGDVLPFFREGGSRSDLLLATHGDQELQEVKIRSSGIPVDIPFAVTQTKKSEIIAQYPRDYAHVLFVDDKPDSLREVKEKHPSVETYLMQRTDDHPYSKTGQRYDGVDRTVATLFDVRL